MEGRLPLTPIPCPVCRTQLPFDPAALLRGEKVTCGTCETAIGIEPGGEALATMDAFAAARRGAQAVKVERKARR